VTQLNILGERVMNNTVSKISQGKNPAEETTAIREKYRKALGHPRKLKCSMSSAQNQLVLQTFMGKFIVMALSFSP